MFFRNISIKRINAWEYMEMFILNATQQPVNCCYKIALFIALHLLFL